MPEVEVKIEARVDKMQEDKAIVEPGELGAILELTVKDRDGKVTERRVQKSRSFVRQFLELLFIQASQIPEKLAYQMREIYNNLWPICFGGNNFGCNASVGQVDNGIVIGTGTTAPAIDDYKLESQIPHATMNHGAVTFGLPTSDANTSHFTITRDFSNVSGGAITVNEIGLYVYGYRYDIKSKYLTIRDVIPGGIDVPNGQTLTVNYRLQAAV